MLFFFFNDTATTEIYTLSLHDALPISWTADRECLRPDTPLIFNENRYRLPRTRAYGESSARAHVPPPVDRSEEHTSELQSRQYLVCRLLLEKKKYKHVLQILNVIHTPQ